MKFGQKVRDKITGFEGILTGTASYISGCSQGCVAPIAKDNTFKDSQWFDEQRLEVVNCDIISLDNGETPGADAPAPSK